MSKRRSIVRRPLIIDHREWELQKVIDLFIAGKVPASLVTERAKKLKEVRGAKKVAY